MKIEDKELAVMWAVVITTAFLIVENQAVRWAVLEDKLKRYGETWKNYPITALLMLAFHRMEEVTVTHRITGKVDIDNLMDAMNFSDFVLYKARHPELESVKEVKG